MHLMKRPEKYYRGDPWTIAEEGFNPEKQRLSESIFSVSNEYMRWTKNKGQVNFPGGGNNVTFISPGGIEGIAERMAYSQISGIFSLIWDEASTVDRINRKLHLNAVYVLPLPEQGLLINKIIRALRAIPADYFLEILNPVNKRQE